MDKFRQGTIDILVATDVAARGIDVDDVEWYLTMIYHKMKSTMYIE